MVAAARLVCEAHAEDSCGLINGRPEGQSFISLIDVAFSFVVEYNMRRI